LARWCNLKTEIDLVQPLGNRFGRFEIKPFIQLDGDDRTGSSVQGENHINGNQWDQIERIVIYAYIYQGAAMGSNGWRGHH
jgi:tellurite resistance protein TerA